MSELENIFWETASPSVEALERFAQASDGEFPHSYSGQAWRAAYRLWLAIKDKTPEEIDKAISDPYGYDKSWNWNGENGGEDLGLSGFMAGWAMNAVRQMMKLGPIGNGAVVTIGVGM